MKNEYMSNSFFECDVNVTICHNCIIDDCVFPFKVAKKSWNWECCFVVGPLKVVFQAE